MSEEFIKVTDTQTHRHTELLPELLVGAKKSYMVTGGGGGGWINPLQTISQGPLLTFRKLVQELTRT